MNAHGQLDALQGETPTCSKPKPIYSVNGLEQAVVKVMEIAHSTFVRGAFPMDKREPEAPSEYALQHPYGNYYTEDERREMPFLC